MSSLVQTNLFSLQDVLMQDSRLYLIFEFLSMDLKKYLDSIPSGQYLDRMLVKVRKSKIKQKRKVWKKKVLAHFCPEPPTVEIGGSSIKACECV